MKVSLALNPEITTKIQSIFPGLIGYTTRESTCEGMEDDVVIDINIRDSQDKMFVAYDKFIGWLLVNDIDNVVTLVSRE